MVASGSARSRSLVSRYRTVPAELIRVPFLGNGGRGWSPGHLMGEMVDDVVGLPRVEARVDRCDGHCLLERRMLMAFADVVRRDLQVQPARVGTDGAQRSHERGD